MTEFTVRAALKIPEVQQLLLAAQYCLRYHSHDSALPASLAVFREAEEAACPKCRGFGKVWNETGNRRDAVCPECQGTGERK
jgi:DnaJ-class molecular chaperone